MQNRKTLTSIIRKIHSGTWRLKFWKKNSTFSHYSAQCSVYFCKSSVKESSKSRTLEVNWVTAHCNAVISLPRRQTAPGPLLSPELSRYPSQPQRANVPKGRSEADIYNRKAFSNSCEWAHSWGGFLAGRPF